MTSFFDEYLLSFDSWLLPLLAVVFAIIAVMAGHILRLAERWVFFLAYLCLGIALLLDLLIPERPLDSQIFGIAFDPLGKIGFAVVVSAFIGVIAMAQSAISTYHHKMTSVLLLLISLLGALVTVVSHSWMLMFAAVQCLSLPIYALLAFDAEDKAAISASVRYLVLSSIAMAFTLFGIMMLYAATGTMDFYQQAIDLPLLWQESSGLILFGFAFILVGMAFKLSVFPFSFWVPEVYQGARPFVLSHLAVVSKAAILIAFVRAWLLVFSIKANITIDVLESMAIASMWVGSILMLFEKNFIRFLAYLSIAHLGFLLTPLFARSILGVEAILIDFAAFSLAMLLVLSALWRTESRSLRFDDFLGKLKKTPRQAAAMLIGLLSLAGVPLTAGFVGKYAIFSAIIDAKLVDLLPHMVITSLFSIVALARYALALFESSESYFLNEAEKCFTKGPLAVVLASILFCFGVFPEISISWLKTQSENLPFFSLPQDEP